MALGSPFDYESSTLLFIPSDMPEPNQHGYEKMSGERLVQLGRAAGGRMLSLFTSYAQLKRTSYEKTHSAQMMAEIVGTRLTF